MGRTSGVRVDGDQNLIRGNQIVFNDDVGLYFTSSPYGADDNAFDGNFVHGNQGILGTTCATPPPGACAAPDFCDNGTGNTPFPGTTNLMPGGC